MPSRSENHGGSVLYVCALASVAALGGLLFGYDTAVSTSTWTRSYGRAGQPPAR